MLKKTLSVILSLALAGGGSAMMLSAPEITANAAETDAAAYTYTVTPILSPFNEYFFVKTDNPDPESFRFADKSSVYSDSSTIEVATEYDWDQFRDKICLFADVDYEDTETARVNGGYIFTSFNTDGGDVVLQAKDMAHPWSDSWTDTDVQLVLPELEDDVDYLIDTYADKEQFFDNMDAIQKGFSSICLYSGSYIRGELYKPGEYWYLSNSPHKDQKFYLQSPYSRKDNEKLFAAYVYPFINDSLGFPSVMAAVSARLDPSSTYAWDDASHYLVNVTYNGETKSYGGQGNGKGESIDKEMIAKRFNFDGDDDITLEGTRQLLDDYSRLEIKDDIPREDALTWGDVCETVGDGAWVRMVGITSIYGGNNLIYTYLYKDGKGTYFYTDEAGKNGAEIYWSGDLGFFSNTWFDGRYIDAYEKFVRGAKFDDYPTGNIFLRDVTIPQVSYFAHRDSATGEIEYTVEKLTEETQDVLFTYKDGVWEAGYDATGVSCSTLRTLVEKGAIDEKYLDMATLTLDEVKALEVDKNTDVIPEKGFLYDRTAAPGTPYEIVSITDPSVNVSLSSQTFIYSGKKQTPEVTISRNGKELIEGIDYTLEGDTSATDCGTYKITVKGIGIYSGEIELTYSIEVLAGDVDQNGDITIADAIAVQKHVVNILKLEGNAFTAADVDKNGVITIADAIMIQKSIVGILTLS